MNLVDKLKATLRKYVHGREIQQSLDHYERLALHSPERVQRFADAGTFRSQVDRLFSIGSASETGQLKRIAEGVVTTTLANRYYRAADYLSDILDDLERHTYLTEEPLGESPIASLPDGYARERKLEAVKEAWLVPLKVAAIETALAHYGNAVGRLLPYSAFQRFERNTARLFALVGESEVHLVEDHLERFLKRWSTDENARRNPARVVAGIVSYLTGEKIPEGVAQLPVRRRDQPLRLGTVVPEARQHYLRASFHLLEIEP